MTAEEFRRQLTVNNIILDEEQCEQFEKYALILVKWNEIMNLTAITSPQDIYEKHFFDSILPFIKHQPAGNLCDVGSGAGFPGVVIKIVYPQLQVTLLEPLQKRVVFLNALIAELKLTGIEVVNARAEEYVLQHRESFDWVTARAVAKLTVLAELCLPLVRIGGCFIALKGQNGQHEYEEASRAIKLLGGKLADEGTVKLNTETTRYNLLISKDYSTPVSYPRSYAAIKRKPL
ncbi:Ribosomal RNA small subunit methyltransferase G [bioreactor metagenome]|uniref:Ribosomal RNA small subunit methyltransferase G n=1 Tax=bioreactor metagenome TaxID=1076179 RepID=A0A644Z814_9ZZZZ|nr:16S rRNA (guanine(527)-N(7))-methyltransferase RsmG [Erysipelotrichaceae bacterium]